MPHPTMTLRQRAAVVRCLAVAVAVVSVGLGVAGLGPRTAHAQQECDAQCWAILAYLTEQGLSPEEIEDLGNSGIAPTTTAPPVTATTAPPAATTTAPPAATTTVPPATTTTAPTVSHASTTVIASPSPAVGGGCDPSTTWACDEVNAGITEGYLPESFNPDDPADPHQLVQIINAFGDQNPNFDAEAAERILLDMEDVDRGDMFNALAAGLGIPYNPEDSFESADKLGALGIVYGHDGDPTSNSDPEDTDPGGDLSNAAVAALLDRIQDHAGGGGPTRPSVGQPTVTTAPSGTTRPTPSDPDSCAANVVLAPGESSLFAAQLRWRTLVAIEARGEPGVPWPPHPDVPGGAEYLVVSQSPVWPVVDAGALWETVNQDDGCVWVATHLETQVSQMLPWRSGHRRTLETAARFGTYLRRWDSLTPAQQAQTIQHHRNGDVNVRCALEAAMVSEDSYDQCRWTLPEPGVWSWQTRACFEAAADQAVLRDCATLAQGVEWFLGIGDYTSGITVRADPDGAANLRPRHPQTVG